MISMFPVGVTALGEKCLPNVIDSSLPFANKHSAECGAESQALTAQEDQVYRRAIADACSVIWTHNGACAEYAFSLLLSRATRPH
jgi:hypothetical protein